MICDIKTVKKGKAVSADKILIEVIKLNDENYIVGYLTQFIKHVTYPQNSWGQFL